MYIYCPLIVHSRKVKCSLATKMCMLMFIWFECWQHCTGSCIILRLMQMLGTAAILGVTTAAQFQTYEVSSLACPHTMWMLEEWVYSGQLLLDAEGNRNCTMTIHADYSDHHRLMFYFSSDHWMARQGKGTSSHWVQSSRKGDIDTTEDDGLFSYLKVYDGNTVDQAHLIAEFNNDTRAGQMSSPVYVTTQNTMTLIYFNNSTDPDPSNTTYAITFTAFREGFCDSSEYRCHNSRCIFHGLSCEGHNPCGDNSDCQISIPAMAAIALGGFCTLGTTVLLGYIIVQNTKDRFDLERQPRKFSPAKAFGSFKSFTPATVTFTPLQRKWSTA